MFSFFAKSDKSELVIKEKKGGILGKVKKNIEGKKKKRKRLRKKSSTGRGGGG